MSNLRFWVLLLALTSFAIGLAAGTGIAVGLQRPAPVAGPFADYERKLVGTLDLSPERARLLRVILASYDRAIEEIKDQHMAAYTSAMEPELVEKGRYYQDLILNRVVPESQRPELQRLALASSLPLPKD